MFNFKDKEKSLRQYNNYILAKTLSMFEWENLPETIPAYELEKMLQVHGYAFITEVEGELYAFTGGLGGVPDVYGNPTEIIISNPALNFNKTLDLKKDGVLICNDDLRLGIERLMTKYNSFLVENDLNMLIAGYSTRMQLMISASDDKTKASADSYLEKLVNGELAVIGENALFEGVKKHALNLGQNQAITSMVEFHQYIRGTLFHELGLNSAFNMKRERLTENEVNSNDDMLYPFVDNMMKARLVAVQKLAEMFQLDVQVDYGSIWSEKNKELVDGNVNESAANESEESLEDELEPETDVEEQEEQEEQEEREEQEEQEDQEEETIEAKVERLQREIADTFDAEELDRLNDELTLALEKLENEDKE